MSEKPKLITPRLPRGFEDRTPGEIAAVGAMIDKIKAVYERYGFDPVETPLFEYTETLGKFLPDTDRPNAGVFSLQDDDEQWMSLRYDLTAPLARFFAENFETLPKPYRSYRQGYVFRNEKPGPGRFRQFMQFDADTVGASGPEADAEMCMMMADVMDALGLAGKYVVKVNNRKVLDGVLAATGITSDAQKLNVLRAIDKFDRLGLEGVEALLRHGRIDESGARMPGAGLGAVQARYILSYLNSMVPAGQRLDPRYEDRDLVLHAYVVQDGPDGTPGEGGHKDEPFTLGKVQDDFAANENFRQGVSELQTIELLARAAGYGDDKIKIDPSVVRGLEYYTGPVFEIELTFKVQNEKGQDVVFGSVGGGGRYDGLVSRFRREPVPATGFSIGVSRLANALKLTGNLGATEPVGPVVVLVMDKDQTARYQAMVSELRQAGIRAEMFLGSTKNFGKQVAYADKRNSPIVIIEGSQEREQGILQVKDLIAGKQAAQAITDNAEWKAARPGQFEIKREELVSAVQKLLSEQ
ncbi:MULTISPECIES: histidine--tRNA ligase [Devosia]|uniref:Histidine--tRNA ligase n=1 Tax=Devosia equisanguinis TaxID=2490941 RepID=A0A3S4D618_9HYPH|nr:MULTISPECIES: histidine--tRNA ligase [Devosia]ODT47622.1 MAG: histidine--tRNA ligase [Pelagibacterium sp. SCN 63-126]ODU88322.1 MAG: histidine--tRNA ligase [Pelagibacterium sp. SCN 63-17]OJX42670.1 MAG: histidine--tRNA ligase [Devosia sp. 63-57]VDS05308.1 Histidine--tRNA ligase [Devosia equisanguinis]